MRPHADHSAEASPLRRPPGSSKQILQIVVGALSVIPLGTGLAGVILGPAMIAGSLEWPRDLDSHFRYLSGLLVGIGLLFCTAIPHIERKTTLFQAGVLIVFVGGLARLWGLLVAGPPSSAHLLGLSLELVIVPALGLWQRKVVQNAPPCP